VDVELNRAESELHHEESALYTELSRLAEVSRELSGRLAALADRAAGLNEPALTQRAATVPPPVDPVGAFANAHAAREAAVKVRRETTAAVRQQLAATKAQLQKLAQQVLADEKLAQHLEAQAKQAALEARQAQVAAPAKPPPPPPAALGAPPPAPPGLALASKTTKRQRPRVRMQAAVDVQSDDNFFNGFSSNISDGGLFVATVNLVPLGTEVDLSFTLPSGARIETKGVVRWVREVNDKLPEAFPGMGVQFKELDPAALQAIEAFLAERDPLFYTE
jgi:uncharacterized protein (TIGR02266 family)